MDPATDSPQEVLFRYVDAVNTERFDRLAETVFAPDAVVELPGQEPIAGADAIVTWLVSYRQGLTHGFQFLQGSSASILGDRAVGRCYVTELGRTTDDRDFTVSGVYDDEFVRLGQGWRFARRRFQFIYRHLGPSTGTFYRIDEARPAGREESR